MSVVIDEVEVSAPAEPAPVPGQPAPRAIKPEQIRALLRRDGERAARLRAD